MKLTDEQKQAYAFAIRDIENGHVTLWTNRLKEEQPELYKYAINKAKRT